MSTLTHAAAAGTPTSIVAALRRRAHALRDAWRRATAAMARRRRLARSHSELAELDDATLRDLAMRRAEFASYWAESEGMVEATRSRILRQLDRQLGW